MKLSVQYITAVLLLIGVIGGMRHYDRVEQAPVREAFSAFPFEIQSQASGGRPRVWMGRQERLEKDVLETLRVDDYILREYSPATQGGSPKETLFGSLVPIWLYVGYYQSQRTGVTYHSPLNCLPGSGWSIVTREVVPLTLGKSAVGAPADLPVNKVLIQKGLEKQLILYWYQDRGRIITSEYWAKAYLLWDAITRNRTDGSLVRLSIPVQSSPEEAFEAGQTFLRDVYPLLNKHLPV
jgi:EpsI family protein